MKRSKKADEFVEVKGEVTEKNRMLTWDACFVEGGRPHIDTKNIKSIVLKVEAGECAFLGVECYRKIRKSEKIKVSTPMTEWCYFPVQKIDIRTLNFPHHSCPGKIKK